MRATRIGIGIGVGFGGVVGGDSGYQAPYNLLVTLGESTTVGPPANINGDAAVPELASTSLIKVHNNNSGAVENYHIGVNSTLNQWGTSGLEGTFGAVTHAWGLQLTHLVSSGYWNSRGVGKPLYYLPAGQSGSKLEEWNSAGTYFTQFATWYGQTIAGMSETANPICVIAEVINNAITSTLTTAQYKTKLLQLIADYRSTVGDATARVILILGDSNDSAFYDPAGYNAKMLEIEAADDNVDTLDPSGCELNPADFHYSYLGYKQFTNRLAAKILGKAAQPVTIYATPALVAPDVLNEIVSIFDASLATAVQDKANTVLAAYDQLFRRIFDGSGNVYDFTQNTQASRWTMKLDGSDPYFQSLNEMANLAPVSTPCVIGALMRVRAAGAAFTRIFQATSSSTAIECARDQNNSSKLYIKSESGGTLLQFTPTNSLFNWMSVVIEFDESGGTLIVSTGDGDYQTSTDADGDFTDTGLQLGDSGGCAFDIRRFAHLEGLLLGDDQSTVHNWLNGIADADRPDPPTLMLSPNSDTEIGYTISLNTLVGGGIFEYADNPGFNGPNIINSWIKNQIMNVPAATGVVTGLTSGTRYYFRIKYVSSLYVTGNEATADAPPEFTLNAISSTEIDWTVDVDTSYDAGIFEYSPNSDYSSAITLTSWTHNGSATGSGNITGLTAATTYYFRSRYTSGNYRTDTKATLSGVPSAFWGANVIPDPNEATGMGWIAFDWEGKIHPQIDAVRGAGGNCVRVMGNVGAVYHGDITLAAYKTNWATLLDYCRAKGVYVYPCMSHPFFRASAILGNASTAGSIIHTIVNLISAVLNSYSDIILPGIDLWNEPQLSGDATQQGLSSSDAGALYTAAKLVTTYSCTYGDFNTPNDFSAGIDSGWVPYLPYCDRLDFHYYTGAAVAGLDTIIAAYPAKSIFFGEYGSPLSAGSANRVALFFKGLALGGKTNCIGSLMWSTTDYDTDTTNMYGFTDSSFVPYDDTVRAMIQYRPDSAIPPGVSTLYSDTFTGSNNTALESHSPEVGAGMVLTSAYGTSITVYLDGSGRIKNADGTNGGLYRPVPQPSSDDFTYEIDYVMNATTSNAGQDRLIGAFLRADGPTPSWRYLLRILPGDGTTGIAYEVDRQVAGSYTGSIRNPTTSVTLGVEYTFRCELTQEGGNVRFRFYHGVAGQQLIKIDDFTDGSAVATADPTTRFVFYVTKQIDSNFTATAVRVYSASSVPTTPAAAPLKEDVNGVPAIYWPAAIVQNFYNYRLYKGASQIYEGTLARYKNAGNTTGSYTYTVVDYAGKESAASPALIVP